MFTAILPHKIEIAKALLSGNDIESHVINKMDSAYSFGEIELYVAEQNETLAKFILKVNNLE